MEGDYNHPADFDGVAYFQRDNFERLNIKFPKSSELLSRISNDFLQGCLIPYRKVQAEQNIVFEEGLLNEIVKHDVYELPLDLHREIMEYSWNLFAYKAIDENKIYIFECSFIQNPITISMIKSNAHEEYTKSFIRNLAHIIEKLKPTLIYIDQKDIEYSFTKVIEERPQEWFDGFTEYYTKQGFGHANGYSGVDGTIRVLNARKTLEKSIYDSLSMKKYWIDNSAFSMEDVTVAIYSILNIISN
ncbi:MAG TPA: hypothetical protein VHQ24_07410, partial [Lachnospiraceae bacterium]|nr:hypothetical protein [Lachnospiraceae bacterium]